MTIAPFENGFVTFSIKVGASTLASRPETALKHAEACRQLPDLAILDLTLPDTSGLKIAEALREIMPELRLFILTPDYSMKVERNALSRGIAAVFSKLDDLASIVANARAACGME